MAHWIRNIAHLAQTRAFWVPDLPGCGESVMPDEPVTGDSVASVIIAGMRQLLGDQACVDIVGFSMGGVISAHIAVLAPDMVNRLILVDTGGLAASVASPPMVSIKGLTNRDELFAAHRQNLLVIMLHELASVDDLALYIQSLNAPHGRLYPRPLVMPDKILHALARSTTRVDAIWGEWDRPHPQPEAQRDALRRLRPDADFFVVPGAGHWAMFESADAFNRILDDLLRSDREGA